MAKLSPIDVLTLCLVYAPPSKWSILASQQLIQDLVLGGPRIIVNRGFKPQRYEEICLCCLQPTGYGLSYDMVVGCSNCTTTPIERRNKLWYLWRELQIELEGPERRLLFQYIYYLLTKIGAIANERK